MIKTVNPAGTVLHVLTSAASAQSLGNPGALVFHHDFQPAWSPDGRRLAFATDWQFYDSGRTWDEWSLSALDTATGTATAVAASAADPTWSKTGLLAYDLHEGPYGDTAGIVAGAHTYDNPPSGDIEWSSPSWSPEGRRFAFEADNVNNQSRIYIMNPDGSYRPLVAGSGPSWSPDGRWIAYQTPSGRDIDAISPNRNQRRHLLTLDLNSATTYSWVWAPSGARIAIGPSIVTLATGKRRDLPVDASGDYPGPSWSPNGHWLVYASNVLQRIRPNGTGRHTINPCALTATTN